MDDLLYCVAQAATSGLRLRRKTPGLAVGALKIRRIGWQLEKRTKRLPPSPASFQVAAEPAMARRLTMLCVFESFHLDLVAKGYCNRTIRTIRSTVNPLNQSLQMAIGFTFDNFAVYVVVRVPFQPIRGVDTHRPTSFFY